MIRSPPLNRFPLLIILTTVLQLRGGLLCYSVWCMVAQWLRWAYNRLGKCQVTFWHLDYLRMLEEKNQEKWSLSDKCAFRKYTYFFQVNEWNAQIFLLCYLVLFACLSIWNKRAAPLYTKNNFQGVLWIRKYWFLFFFFFQLLFIISVNIYFHNWFRRLFFST